MGRISLAVRTLALAAILSLAACQTTGTIEDQASWDKAQPTRSESIVIGRIRWIEDGKEKVNTGKFYSWGLDPRLRNLKTGKASFAKLDPGGNFRWSLEPGFYIIDRLNYRDPWAGSYFFVPKVGFRVAEGGKVYYAGTLRGVFNPKRDFIGGLSGIAAFSVHDELRSELTYIRKSIGVDVGSVEKRLMVHDPKFPVTYDTTAEYQLGMTLLGALF